MKAKWTILHENTNTLTQSLMKHFTLVSLMALCSMQTAFAQPTVKAARPSLDAFVKNIKPVVPNRALAAPLQASTKDVWCPGKRELFYVDSDKGDGSFQTEAAETHNFTYDEKGNVLTETWESVDQKTSKKVLNRYSFVYYDNNKRKELKYDLSKDKGETWVKTGSYIIEYTWDDVTGVQAGAVTLNYSSKSDDYTDQDFSNSFRRDIQRDADGRVLTSTMYRYDDSGKEYVYNRLTATYVDGEQYPKDVVYEDQVWNNTTQSYALGETYGFRNIKWHDCNNQFVVYSSLRDGKNRATSFDFYYNGYKYGVYEMTYGDKYPEYTSLLSYDTGDYDKVTVTLLDDNGSYEYFDRNWYDMNGDGIETDDEVAESKRVIYYNLFGEACGEEQWSGNYGEKMACTYATKNVYEYDETNSYVLSYVTNTWDMTNPVDESGNVNWKPSSKTVYSDFVKKVVTGINGVADVATAVKKNGIYDINGVRVSRMQPGQLYIVGGKKIVAK